MSDANYLSRPLRKHKFTSTGSKDHSLRFVIGGFRSVLWLSVKQGSLLVIVMMINDSQKRNCKGGLWASEVACFWSINCNGLPNKTINVTIIINPISTLPTNTTFTLTSKHARESSYLKGSLAATKHKLIPFKCIHQFLNVFVLLLLILIDCRSQKFCATSRFHSLTSRHLRTKSLKILLWPNPDVNIPNIVDRFHPWTSDFHMR